MIKLASSQRCRDGLTYVINKCNPHINSLKDKKHIIISLDAKKKKALTKSNIPFRYKSWRDQGIQETYINIPKVVYSRQHLPKWRDRQSISAETRNKTRMSTLFTYSV
jgi:hypothetical protein